MPFDLVQLKNFSQGPGVYIMKGGGGTVLYIGKAKSLRNRIRQYFTVGSDGRVMIPELIARLEDIETIVVANETEALLLERNLIRQHKPKYNTFFKDDKSYISIRIDTEEEWPCVSLVRSQGRLADDATYFGPYVSAYDARQVLDILNTTFPLRECSSTELETRKRPCILFQMKRCIAPCVGECSKDDYDAVVQRLIAFMRGKDRAVIKDLHDKMKVASDRMEFEHAAEILAMIRSLKRVFEVQRVENVDYGDTDVVAAFRYGVLVVVARMVFRRGVLAAVKNYVFSGVVQTNGQILQSFVMQRYVESKDVPREILLSEEIDNAAVIAKLLGKHVVITTPQQGEKKALVDMAYANACAAAERQKDVRATMERSLMEMQERFKLMNYPRRIECFDTSHISGRNPVAVMVAFDDGEKNTRRYRKYHIAAENVSGDYKAMQEALTRRYKRAGDERGLPDLIIVDGGRVHLNIVKRVLEDLDITSVDVVAIAKEQGRHDKGMTVEHVYIASSRVPLLLDIDSPVLFLLQRIRDESHRFAVEFHRRTRDKDVLTSELESLIGIGPKKRAHILRHFGSVKRLKEAPDEAVAEVKGLTKTDIDTVLRFKRSIKRKGS